MVTSYTSQLVAERKPGAESSEEEVVPGWEDLGQIDGRPACFDSGASPTGELIDSQIVTCPSFEDLAKRPEDSPSVTLGAWGQVWQRTQEQKK